jgi:hypothetical protein
MCSITTDTSTLVALPWCTQEGLPFCHQRKTKLSVCHSTLAPLQHCGAMKDGPMTTNAGRAAYAGSTPIHPGAALEHGWKYN